MSLQNFDQETDFIVGDSPETQDVFGVEESAVDNPYVFLANKRARGDSSDSRPRKDSGDIWRIHPQSSLQNAMGSSQPSGAATGMGVVGVSVAGIPSAGKQEFLAALPNRVPMPGSGTVVPYPVVNVQPSPQQAASMNELAFRYLPVLLRRQPTKEAGQRVGKLKILGRGGGVLTQEIEVHWRRELDSEKKTFVVHEVIEEFAIRPQSLNVRLIHPAVVLLTSTSATQTVSKARVSLYPHSEYRTWIIEVDPTSGMMNVLGVGDVFRTGGIRCEKCSHQASLMRGLEVHVSCPTNEYLNSAFRRYRESNRQQKGLSSSPSEKQNMENSVANLIALGANCQDPKAVVKTKSRTCARGNPKAASNHVAFATPIGTEEIQKFCHICKTYVDIDHQDGQSHSQLPKRTTTNVAKEGLAVLNVASTTGYVRGQVVEIGTGAQAERRTLQRVFPPKSLQTDEPLSFTHPVGTVVCVVSQPAKEETKKRQNEFPLWSHLHSQGLVAPPPIPRTLLESLPDDRGLIVLPSEVYDPLVVTANHLTRGSMQQGVRGYLASHMQPQKTDPSRAPFAANPAPLSMQGAAVPVSLWGVGGVEGPSSGMDPMALNQRLMMGQEPHMTLANALADPSMTALSPSAALGHSGGNKSVSGRSVGKRDHDEVSTEHYRDVNELLSETSTSHYPWDRGDFDERSSNPSAKRVRSTAPPSVASRSVISHSEAALANLSALEINSNANGTDSTAPFTSPPHPSYMHVAQDAASGKQFIENVVRTPEFATNPAGSPLLHPMLPGEGESPALSPLPPRHVPQTHSLNPGLGVPVSGNGHQFLTHKGTQSRLPAQGTLGVMEVGGKPRPNGDHRSALAKPDGQSGDKKLKRDSSPMLTRAVMDSLNAEQPHPASSSLIQAQLEQMDHNTLAAPRREDVRYAQGRNSLPIHPRSKYYRYSGREEQAGQLRDFLMEPGGTKSWAARHVRIIGAPHCGKKSIVAEVVCGREFAHRDIYWMGRGGQTLQACFEQLEVDTSGLNQKWVNRRRAIIEHLEGLKERPIFIFNGISPEQDHYTPRNADVIHIIPFHLSMSRDVQDLLASRSELAQIARDVERTRDLYTIHISDLTIESALEIFSREFLTHVGIEVDEENGAATEVVRSLLISDRNRQRDRLSINRQNSDLSSSTTLRNTSSGNLSVNAVSPRVASGSPLAGQPSLADTDSLSSSVKASPGRLERKEKSKNDLDRRVFESAGDSPAVQQFTAYNDSGVPDLWDSVCELVALTKVHPAIVVLTGTSLGTKVVELKAQRPNAPIHELVRDPYFISHVQKTVGKPHKIGGTLFAPLLDALQRFLAESESTQFKPYTRLNVIDVMVFLGDFSMPLPDLVALRGNQNQQDELLEYLRCLDSLSIIRFKRDNSAQIPTVSFHPLYRPLLRRMMKEDAMRYAECLHNTLKVVLEHIDIRRLRENPAKRTPFTQALLNLDHGLAYHSAQWIREHIAEHLRTNTIHPLLSSMIYRCAEFTYRLGWFFRLTKDGKPNEVMWQTATALEFLEHLPATRERALAIAKLVETQGAVISAAGYRDQGAISQHLFMEGDTGFCTAFCSKSYCIGCDSCQQPEMTFPEILERVRFNSLLAFSLYRSRMFYRALSCAETVIGLIEQLLHDPQSCDKSSTDYLDAINDLALCHRLAACVHLSAGRPDKAQMHFKTSVNFHQFAHRHPQFYQIADYTRTMNALAKFWFEREELEKAHECYQQVRQNLLEVDGRLASRVGSAPAYEYAAVAQNLSSLAVEQLFLKWYVRAPNSMNGTTLLAWVFEARRLPVEEGVRGVIARAREEWSQALERVPISSGESAALAPVRVGDESSGTPNAVYGEETTVGEDGNTDNVFFNDSIVVHAVALSNRAVLETWIAVTYPQMIMPRSAQHRGDIDLVNVSEDCKVRGPDSVPSEQRSCEYEIEQRRKQTLFASLVDIQRAIRLMRGMMTFQGVEVTYLDLALSVCYSSLFISGLSSTLSVKMACDTCIRNNGLTADASAAELLFDWLSHPAPAGNFATLVHATNGALPDLTVASGSGIYLLGLAQDALIRSLRRDSKNRHWVSKDNPLYIPSWHRARVLHATGVVGFMRTLSGLFQDRRVGEPKLTDPSVADLFEETLQSVRWSIEMQESLMGDEAGALGKHAPVYSLTKALQREVEATVANQDSLDHEGIARLLLGCQRWLLFPQHLFSKMSAT